MAFTGALFDGPVRTATEAIVAAATAAAGGSNGEGANGRKTEAQLAADAEHDAALIRTRNIALAGVFGFVGVVILLVLLAVAINSWRDRRKDTTIEPVVRWDKRVSAVSYAESQLYTDDSDDPDGFRLPRSASWMKRMSTSTSLSSFSETSTFLGNQESKQGSFRDSPSPPNTPPLESSNKLGLFGTISAIFVSPTNKAPVKPQLPRSASAPIPTTHAVAADGSLLPPPVGSRPPPAGPRRPSMRHSRRVSAPPERPLTIVAEDEEPRLSADARRDTTFSTLSIDSHILSAVSTGAPVVTAAQNAHGPSASHPAEILAASSLAPGSVDGKRNSFVFHPPSAPALSNYDSRRTSNDSLVSGTSVPALDSGSSSDADSLHRVRNTPSPETSEGACTPNASDEEHDIGVIRQSPPKTQWRHSGVSGLDFSSPAPGFVDVRKRLPEPPMYSARAAVPPAQVPGWRQV